MSRRWGGGLLAACLAAQVLACQGPTPAAAPTKKTNLARKAESPAPSPAPTATSPATGTPPPVVTPIQAVSPPAPSPPAASGAPGATAAGLLVRLADQASDTWRAGPALQRPRAGLVAGPYAGNLAVLEGDTLATLEVLDPEAGYWRLDESHVASKQPSGFGLRDGRSFLGSAVHGGFLYTAGGSSDLGTHSEVLRWLAPGTREWVGDANAPAMAPAVGVVGDRLVVAGGYDPLDGIRAGISVFQLPEGFLDHGAAAVMPAPVAGGAGLGFGGKLWVFGGYELDDAGRPRALTSVQAYDPVKDSWTRDGASGGPAPLPVARHSGAAAVIGGRIFLVGGSGADGAPLQRVDVFEPLSGTWSRGADLPTARAALALAVHDGALWAIGGFDAAGRATTAVEVYRP